MKVLVIYDSQYGNTASLAKAIGGAVSGEIRVVSIKEIDPAEPGTFDLLIIGSPTQGGRPTQAMQDFLGKLPGPALKDKKAAVFDTRLTSKWVSIFGFAAGRIADSLKKKGAQVLSAEGFLVTGTKSSIKEGELERAAAWAKEMENK